MRAQRVSETGGQSEPGWGWVELGVGGMAGGGGVQRAPWGVRKVRPVHWVTFPHDLFSAVASRASPI